MAKKSEKVAAERPSFSDIVCSEIDKQFGEVMTSGDHVITEERMVIPFSPIIDPLIGGGIAEGTWVTLSGRYGSGKSTCAMRIAANAQKPEYGSRNVYLLSVEARYTKEMATGTRGLITTKPRFNVIESRPDHILSAEDFLRIGDLILNSHPGCVLVIDSPSAFASQEARAQGVDYQNRGQVNKTFSEFVRQNAQVCRVNKSIVIACVHLQKTQGIFSTWDEKIAESLNYAATTKLRIKFDKPFKDSSEKQIGQELHWEVDKSCRGSGSTATGFIRYGLGVDENQERLIVGQDLGLIDKSGSHYTFSFLDEPLKAHGLQQAWELLEANPDVADKLAEKIKEII